MQALYDHGGGSAGRKNAVYLYRFVAGQAGCSHRRQAGRERRRLRAGHRQRPQPARFEMRRHRARRCDHQMHLAREQRVKGRGVASEWHAHDVDARHGLEQLHREMRRGSRAAGTIVELSRARPGVRNQVFNGLHRERRMHNHGVGRFRGPRDRREVPDHIERRVAAQQRDDPDIVGVEQQRVAIGLCLGHDVRRDDAARAAAIVHDHGLAQAASQSLHDQARREIVAAARLRGHQAYGLAWIVLAGRRHSAGDHAEREQHRNVTREFHLLFSDTRLGTLATCSGRPRKPCDRR